MSRRPLGGRRRGVRRLEDEHGDRLAVAELALETLRRPRRALALYKLALADAAWLQDELRPRIAALETENLGGVSIPWSPVRRPGIQARTSPGP